MKLTVKKPFSWAHRGVTVEHFEVGQTIETEDQDLIDVSTKEGWTSKGRTQAAKPADTTQPPGDAKTDTSDTDTSAGETNPATGDTGANAGDTGDLIATDTNTGI